MGQRKSLKKLRGHVRAELTRGLPESVRCDPSLRLDRLVLISAYAGPRFFKALRKEFEPRRVHVVLDAGTPSETLRQIQSALGRSLVRPCLVGISPGLMHAKLYLCEWKSKGRTRPTYTLNLGSANASEGGFSPALNSEAMAAFRVYRGRDSALFDYLRPVEAGGPGTVRATRITVDGADLSLPGFALAVAKSRPHFDAWLQRGGLCHRFQPDPSFLSFMVRLRQPLPIREDVRNALKAAALLEDGGIKSLRQRYVEVKRPPRDEPQQTRWRTTYFVETSLGHWTSEGCFRMGGDTFRPRGSDEREAVLLRVADAEKPVQQQWVDRFVHSLQDAERELRDRGLTPDDWFGEEGEAGLNVGAEEARCWHRVRADQRKAADRDFRARWATGHDFPRVPQFRLDATAWRQFTYSFAASVSLQAHKLSVPNLFAQVCREFDEFGKRFDDPERLLEWWRFGDDWDELLTDWRSAFEERLGA